MRLSAPASLDVGIEERVGRIEAVAAAAVYHKRNWVTSDELDALPDVLQLDEVPRVVSASHQRVVADGRARRHRQRRALFLYVGGGAL